MTTRYGVDESGLTKQTSGGKSDDVDIGFAKPFGGMVVPPGYLYCDGSEVSRQAYDKLFAVIGTTWGEGDGENTFNLPDLRGIFIRCDGGENNAEIGVRQEDAIREITGEVSVRPGAQSSTSIEYASGAFEVDNDAGASAGSGYSGGGGNPNFDILRFVASNIVPTAPENRPVNVAMKYCIRYE